jgi:hypothetical protein
MAFALAAMTKRSCAVHTGYDFNVFIAKPSCAKLGNPKLKIFITLWCRNDFLIYFNR